MSYFDMSDVEANRILDALPTLYVGLSSTYPGLDGSNITEPAQSDYVRPAVSLAAAASRQRVSNALADFINGGGNAAASAGSFPYAFLISASSGGTLRYRCILSLPVAWVVGLPVEIASGQITIGFPSS